jgi:hypothetical protein
VERRNVVAKTYKKPKLLTEMSKEELVKEETLQAENLVYAAMTGNIEHVETVIANVKAIHKLLAEMR